MDLHKTPTLECVEKFIGILDKKFLEHTKESEVRFQHNHKENLSSLENLEMRLTLMIKDLLVSFKKELDTDSLSKKNTLFTRLTQIIVIGGGAGGWILFVIEVIIKSHLK